MAYNDDRHIHFDVNQKEFDSFDPLLVSLYDNLIEYKKKKHEETSDLNGLTEAVMNILDANLTTKEQGLASDVLLELIKQVEQDIRANLSAKLALRDDLPAPLLHYLAYDEIIVADPVLRYSPLLSDADLYYIIQSKTSDHWQSIAARESISSKILNTLVDRHDPRTFISLLKNETINLNPYILDIIRDLACKTGELAQEFVQYKHLPREMAVDIYWHVSNNIRQDIVTNFDVKEREIDNALQDCVQDFSDTMLRPDKIDPSPLMHEVTELYWNQNKITDYLLVTSLRRRQGRFFIALFQKRSSLSKEIF